MSFWPNKGEEDPRPAQGAAYERLPAVEPGTPAVPEEAFGALRLPFLPVSADPAEGRLTSERRGLRRRRPGHGAGARGRGGRGARGGTHAAGGLRSGVGTPFRVLRMSRVGLAERAGSRRPRSRPPPLELDRVAVPCCPVTSTERGPTACRTDGQASSLRRYPAQLAGGTVCPRVVCARPWLARTPGPTKGPRAGHAPYG